MRRVCRPGGVVAARDGDYGGFFWFPADPGLDEWQALYRDVARALGGEPDAGRHLLSWCRAAGFSDVAASASAWCYTGPADRPWWGLLWAQRLTETAFGDRAVEHGLATRQDLARLAEDLIAFSGPGYGFLTLPEAFTTGSSLMPQKKNPDALELVRGKAARVDGDLLRLLTLMKGLPAGYQKDLQEDKEAVFDAADTAAASLAVMKGVVSGLGLAAEAMRRAAQSEEMMAAGLAVALAREGMPFRRAHALVGSLVAEAQKTGSTLRETAARALPAQAPAVAARLPSLFDPEQVVRTKAAPGGTAPDAVRAALEAARARVVV